MQCNKDKCIFYNKGLEQNCEMIKEKADNCIKAENMYCITQEEFESIKRQK